MIPTRDGSRSELRRRSWVVGDFMPYSQGQTKVRVNKVKLVKRSMYGRGKLNLLRQGVFYAAS
jgi:transposase